MISSSEKFFFSAPVQPKEFKMLRDGMEIHETYQNENGEITELCHFPLLYAAA